MSNFFNDIAVSGKDWWRIAAFFLSILISLIVGRLARFFLERSRKKTKTGISEWGSVLLKALSKPIVMVVFTAGWWVGIAFLPGIGEKLGNALNASSRILFSIAVGYVLYSLTDVADHYLDKFVSGTRSKVDDVLAPLVGKSIRITIFVIVTLNVVHVVSGQSITTILAGLGVGGLAIALAGQDTIKNFFGSIVILGDRPFEIGDRIVVDGYDGPVESVGFRSTRLNTLDGHQVTVPNSEMVNKTIRNISKRPYIRRVANITITYDTSPKKIERAIEIIKEILSNHEGMRPDFPPRVYFNEFNDWSLNIIMIYWYHPPDYWKYMEFTQHTNMEILKRFNEENIEFAFPTQTICLENEK
ncbi:mechanosensitive ion channel family protein [Verrucomicrobiota bacterium]